MSCTNTAQAGQSALNNKVTGIGTPDPAIYGVDTVTVSGAQFEIGVPGTILVAGYSLGLLNLGVNNIPAVVNLTIAGSHTTEGTAVFSTGPGPDGVLLDNPLTPGDEEADNTPGPDGFGLSVLGTTTISDPTPAVKNSGDETATPLAISATIPTSTWTPSDGADIQFTLASSDTTALVGPGGVIAVTFSCVPGTPGPAGCELLPPVTPPAPPNCNTVIPLAAPVVFDTVDVQAPPTAPVCTNESTSVGVTQSQPINLTDNCTDVNQDIDLSTFVLETPGPGEGTITGSNGVYTYTAPANDPGAPVTLNFHVDDEDPATATSNDGVLSITVLANSCTAPQTSDPNGVPGSGDETTGPCSLTEIVVQPVVGTTMSLSKDAGLVMMSPVILNGQAQASTGSLQNLTVNNARGTSAGWTLSGFVTDLGAPGSPTMTLPTGQTISVCSSAGALGAPGIPAHRLCIPGDNMGWTPTASIAHNIIFGDVAQVSPGSSDASGASDWLSQLVAAGSAGKDGIGGLQEQNVLCSSPTDHSGGTFACDAALYLGVPASAGAGTYTGGLVLTLL